MPEWNPLFFQLNEMRIASPSAPGGLRGNRPKLLSDNQASNPVFGQLRRAAKAQTSGSCYAERRSSCLHIREGWDAFKLAEGTAAGSVSSSELGRSIWRSAADIGSGEQDCGGLSTRAKLLKVPGNTESVQRITQFADSGAKLNLLRNCD